MSKQNLRVMRTQFEVVIVLKDELFTKTGRLKRKMRKGLGLMIREEGHRFLEAHDPVDIVKHSVMEVEEVEVEDEDQGQL